MVTFSTNGSVRSALFLGLLVSLSFLVSSCTISTRPIYFDNELAIAERATAKYRELHNQQDFKAIYNLLDKTTHTGTAEDSLREIQTVFENVGKTLQSQLVEKKVFAGPHGFTSQVKLAYGTKFEKGDWTELFVWNIKDSNEPVLVQYILEPTSKSSSSSSDH
jgi:hypothetical protein